MDRFHATAIAPFGSVSRANVRLEKLLGARLLARTLLGTITGGRKAVYSLTEAGRNLIDAPVSTGRDGAPGARTLFLEHSLKINDIEVMLVYERYLPAGVTCQTFRRLSGTLTPSVPLIPDAYAELAGNETVSAFFLEVDCGTEPLGIWRRKIEHYLAFAVSGQFPTLFNQQRFRVLIVAESHRRVESIRALAAKRTDRIFWSSTFDIINRDGFCAPVWRKPSGTEMLPLV